MGANDEFKTSFLEDSGIFPHMLLSSLLCDTGNVRDALYVEELGRARGLSDLMAEKYSVETHISADPKSWFGIENILEKIITVFFCTFLTFKIICICGS